MAGAWLQHARPCFLEGSMNVNATDRQKTAGQTARTDTTDKLTAEIVRSETGVIHTRYRLNGRTYTSIDEVPTGDRQ